MRERDEWEGRKWEMRWEKGKWWGEGVKVASLLFKKLVILCRSFLRFLTCPFSISNYHFVIKWSSWGAKYSIRSVPSPSTTSTTFFLRFIFRFLPLFFLPLHLFLPFSNDSFYYSCFFLPFHVDFLMMMTWLLHEFVKKGKRCCVLNIHSIHTNTSSGSRSLKSCNYKFFCSCNKCFSPLISRTISFSSLSFEQPWEEGRWKFILEDKDKSDQHQHHHYFQSGSILHYIFWSAWNHSSSSPCQVYV